MQFEQQEIEAYIASYAKHFNETLSLEDAESQMRQLLELYLVVAQPLPDRDVYSL